MRGLYTYISIILGLMLARLDSAFAATSCSAGYYLSDSTCYICPVGYYCTGGTATKTACSGTTYSDTKGATSCKSCPKAVKYASLVSMYHYWTFSGEHDSIDGCHVFFSTTSIPNGNVDTTQMLCYIGSDNDYGVSRRTCQVLTEYIRCNAGYWNSQNSNNYAYYENYDQMYNNMCTPVGEGYYSPANAITKTACPTGEKTTGYGTGADEAVDCGLKLNIGGHAIYMRSERRTTPSLQAKYNGKIYYGDADSTNTKGNLHLKRDNIIYSIYDDTM